MAARPSLASKALACIALVVLAALPISSSAGTPLIDPAKATITLERSACYGPCPVYKVQIHGDGRVQFSTKTAPMDQEGASHSQYARFIGVLIPGTHEDRVSPGAVESLIRKFQAAGFWHLKNEYSAETTDLPTYSLTIDTGRQRKTVVNYAGERVGMPPVVTELENAVDTLAGTDRWISGSPALIPWLERVRFDFRSFHAAELAVAGEWDRASEATVSALIDRGAPLDQPVSIGGRSAAGRSLKPEAAGMSLIRAAIWRGHAGVFKQMVALGWLDRLGKLKAAEYFAQAAAGCSPAMVDAFADAGLALDQGAPRQPDAYSNDPHGQTALAALGASYACQDDEARRVRTAERLIARGANPNHRDSLGRTPIYGVENLDLLNLLLAQGADATAKSNDGQSMIFGSWTDAIVLRLLEAGASPVGRYDVDGNKTLAQQAEYRNMPQVARWLAAHTGSQGR